MNSLEIEKLKMLDKLTNLLHTSSKMEVVDIAYLMHGIINAKEISQEMYDILATYQINSK
jgi:hypothetical protein